MSDQYVAEIRLFAFNFAPQGWAICQGQVLSLAQNTALFSLLGTQYGGDGQSNFALPNLQGSVAMHTDQFAGGGQYPIGAQGGEQSVVLLTSEMPTHTHVLQSDKLVATSSQVSPANTVPGNAGAKSVYSTATTLASQMNVNMVAVVGSNAAHNNMQPYLVLNYCIALQGIYPPRS